MITLEDYINESILEAKAKAEAPKEVVEWFNEAVYSNKKDFGQEKKLKQYKDGGFGLMPGQFAKDRWGEGWFAIRLFEEKNPEKFIEIPEGVSEEFLELCSVVIISQFILEDKRIHEVLKRMPNVEYINITNTTRGRGSQPLCTSTTGDKKYKTSWGDTYELLTMDEIEKLILKQFKGYTLRGRIKVVDVKTTGPEINEIWTEFSKLRNKYNVGNEFGIEGYIQTKYGE
jgi:hypothetical protein